MSETSQFKQNIVLLLILLSFVVSFAAAVAAMVFFWSERQQDNQAVSQRALLPLIVEPNRLDFQGIGKGEGETHEGVVHLVNQSDRPITFLFVDSSCRCSVIELPGDTILPDEKLPVKCTLSTADRISNRAGGEIWIAHCFADLAEDEDKSPMYVRVILTAVVESETESTFIGHVPDRLVCGFRSSQKVLVCSTDRNVLE